MLVMLRSQMQFVFRLQPETAQKTDINQFRNISCLRCIEASLQSLNEISKIPSSCEPSLRDLLKCVNF